MAVDMAHSHESRLRKRPSGLVGRGFSRSLEYLAILIVAGAAVALVAFAIKRDDGKTPALFTGRHFPTCRDAGIVPTAAIQGTCTTRHALVTVGNQGTEVTVPGLSARMSS